MKKILLFISFLILSTSILFSGDLWYYRNGKLLPVVSTWKIDAGYIYGLDTSYINALIALRLLKSDTVNMPGYATLTMLNLKASIASLSNYPLKGDTVAPTVANPGYATLTMYNTRAPINDPTVTGILSASQGIFSSTSVGTNVGVIRFASNGNSQVVIEDLDADDTKNPCWYFQSANNGSKGILYIGYGNRTSTVMYGMTDLFLMDTTSATFGQTIGVGTLPLYALSFNGFVLKNMSAADSNHYVAKRDSLTVFETSAGAQEKIDEQAIDESATTVGELIYKSAAGTYAAATNMRQVIYCWTLDSTALATYGTTLNRGWFETGADSIYCDTLKGVIYNRAVGDTVSIRVYWGSSRGAAVDSLTDVKIYSSTLCHVAIQTKVIPHMMQVWIAVMEKDGNPPDVEIKLKGKRRWY